ncbi:MAG TPA: chromosomal replication initiator protein DnaA [Actinobacteria bacterium]|nr:chromosomal replication initiator protein DnaA [Actinomycetota bacterium]
MNEQLENIWDSVLSLVQGRLNPPTFKTWFAETQPVSFSDNKITISTPNDFSREWLESRYSQLICGCLLEVVGEEFQLEVITQSRPSPQPPTATENPEEPSAVPGSLPHPKTNLNLKYSFDTFVSGSSNRFAHAAALAVAEKPARAYNPLFIYGGVGLGKTHLLQAIGRYVFEHYKKQRVKYVSSEKFTNDFINSIRDKEKIVGFQKKYRDNDVLLVDDIQFLENKEATQEEFFHTFNTLHEAGKQIVISSDRPPKDIATLEERLRTRFESGLIVDIQPPDLETRIAILRKRVAADRIDVDDNILELVASQVQSNIRELEGALIRIAAFSSLTSSPITVTLAKDVLKDVFLSSDNRIVSISQIQSEVCRYYRLSKTELVGGNRSRPVVMPRQVAMYLARELTDSSLPKIGNAFGRRDHTTVLHATKKIERLITENRELYNQIQEITGRIKSR